MRWSWMAFVSLSSFVGACSSSGGTATPPPQDGGSTPTEAGAASLAGTVKDRTGAAVSGAKVAVGTASVFSDVQGKYTLAGVPTGAATVMVSKDWFTPLSGMVTVSAAGVTAY